MLYLSYINELPGPEPFVPLSPDLFCGRGLSAISCRPLRPSQLRIHTAVAVFGAWGAVYFLISGLLGSKQ